METNTNRRRFLATGTAAAVFGALHQAAAAESPIVGLIDAHRAALAAFEKWCTPEAETSEDDPAYPAINAEWQRTGEEEDAAMTAVCAYPARTMEEARIKAAFLAEYITHGEIREHQYEALLNSFLA